jgi:hypothetical protein
MLWLLVAGFMMANAQDSALGPLCEPGAVVGVSGGHGRLVVPDGWMATSTSAGDFLL